MSHINHRDFFDCRPITVSGAVLKRKLLYESGRKRESLYRHYAGLSMLKIDKHNATCGLQHAAAFDDGNRRQLDGQGRARREADRRRNSECKINI